MRIKEGYQEIPIEEFDALCKSYQFTIGPFIESFGEGEGEPYAPFKTVFGALKDGRKVCSIKEPTIRWFTETTRSIESRISQGDSIRRTD